MNLILYTTTDLIEWKNTLREVVILKYYVIEETKEDIKFIKEIKEEMDINIQKQLNSSRKLY